jgi:uncharacterized oligopeptide transporter (OPT) family protein
MALIGVGHLVGLGVGMAMLVGMVLSWGFLVPSIRMALQVTPPPSSARPSR